MIDANLIIECSAAAGCGTLRAIILSVLIFFTLLTGFAYTTLLERRFIAWIQHRVGPNRAGPGGLLFPLADAVKLFFKEDVTPTGADRVVYLIAPALKVIPSILVVAVIPLGPPILIPWFDGLWYRVPLHLIDVNVGVLFILAWLSLGTYGIVLAGWASNNKYSMLGGLRATAQMLSYELSMGTAMAVPILITSSMKMSTIIEAQNNPQVFGWFVFQNPVAAIILIIALLAEVNRAPFDLPEAEQELTAGYHTEYSGMKFALFFMAEYISMISVSMIAVAFFFGGYHFFLVDQVPILGPLVFIVKVILFLCGMIWIRATLPRIRYDRLMSLGWKVLFPLALAAVAWTAVALVLGDALGSPAVYILIMLGASGITLGVLFSLLNRSKAMDEGEYVVLGKRGAGWAIMSIIGGLVAIPVGIFKFLGQQVSNAQVVLKDEKPVN
ncbi:MAG TPA: NADH-quinone oxidoreductase subunit NuoH [Aggregatilineales bacterium]|nr:NADH-quinone oxidoreductase subunit NuoH [Anaerolineales bacterium]HRE47504.1 NADH-quinone oxidoreductase subunit NuoH [Aggregatilineales bacterium]